MAARSVAGRSGAAALSLLVVAFLLTSGLTGSLGPREGSSGLHTNFSATLTIDPNGTVTVPGVFSVTGNTYTLIAPYAGGIEDERDGSTLVGAGFGIDHDSGSAGVLALAVSNVTITGFNITGTGTGIYLYDSLYAKISNTQLSATTTSVLVVDSTYVNLSGIEASATGGVQVETSSDVEIFDSNFNDSSSNGIGILASADVSLSHDDFSHAAGIGLSGLSSTELAVDGNRFDDAGSGEALDLDEVEYSNLSSNDLTGIAGVAEPVVMFDSASDGLWNNSVSSGTNDSFEIAGSSDVQLGDTVGVDPQVYGVYLDADTGVTVRDVAFNGEGTGVGDMDSSNVAIIDSELENGDTSVDAIGASGLSISGSNLTQGNNGLVADNSSQISLQDSDLNRSNYPIYLTATTGVSVADSSLDRAQAQAVYLENDSDISFVQDTLQQSAGVALTATSTDGLSVTRTDFAGSPSQFGPGAVEEVAVGASTFTDDSFEWTGSPFSANDSTGINLIGSDLSNTSGDSAVALVQDQQVLVRDCDFFNDTGEGLNGQSVSNVTLDGSDLVGVHGDGLVENGVTGLVVSSNDFDNEYDSAVFLTTATDFTAYDNSFNNDSYAFFLNGGQEWSIVNNTALADSEGGLSAESVTGLVVEGNNFSQQSGNMAIDLTTVAGFTVGTNALFNDSDALVVSGTSEGTVVGNRFVLDAVSVDFETGVSLLIYHNDFIADEGWQLSAPPLAWDDGYPIGGNYWSNYTGVDDFHGPGQNLSGSDGIGDTSFVLAPLEIDRYPLMKPWVDHTAVFLETGLPEGSNWTVDFNGTLYRSNSSSITINATTGVFTPFEYSIPNVGDYAATPASGTGEMGDGFVLVSVTFAVPTYSLTLSETGLPAGTFWAAVIDGQSFNGSEPSFRVDLPNGTYTYTVDPVAGYTRSAAAGDVTISGAAVSVNVSFVKFTFLVTWIESGLPSGTMWSVTFGPGTAVGVGTTLGQSVGNGTFPFTVGPVAGYSATPTSGVLTVNGSPVDFYVQFAKAAGGTTPTSGPNEVAGSSLLFYLIIGALLVAAAAGWTLFALGRRTRNSAPPPPPIPPAPPPPGTT
jgi:nitrous oxidase accessory protein NosD